MKSIVCVNYEIPTVDNQIEYLSNDSLRDYDVAIFDPKFPYLSRIEFSGGGSCLSIEATRSLMEAITHWSAEIRGALQSGKTVFILLNEIEKELAATGISTATRNQRTYQTTQIKNYDAIPINIDARNATGRSFSVKDGRFRTLYDIIEKITKYLIVLTANNDMKIIFSAKDGATVGTIIRPKGLDGSLVLLPYFSFDHEKYTEERDDVVVWTDDAKIPVLGVTIDATITEINVQIEYLMKARGEQEQAKSDLSEFIHLLYETGKPLERAITKTLQLLGYEVDTLRIGDLEIDHVIVSPSGKRMIGEAEGKDISAIDIGKFRQLSSNIQEDFAREEIDAPAKGVLFANGFRLMQPEGRPEQFTQKSLTNALLHGTALIRTADLYAIAVHLLDHPEDNDFRVACRAAIEDTAGAIVIFPNPFEVS